MKKTIITLLTVCAILPTPLIANAEQNEKESRLSFLDYLSMSNEEFISGYRTERLAECSFGDDSTEDEVKFEKYLNTPPDFYTGESYCSTAYAAYKRFISGEAIPYITLYVDIATPFSEDISSVKFGYPSDWEIEAVNGKWVIELNDGTKNIRPVHEYRMYVPVEVISDFESYVRLEASSHCFTDIVLNNSYGIYHCADIGQQFASFGESRAVLEESLCGDANLDAKTTVADSVAILQHIANRDKYRLSEQGLTNADVDGVEGVTANDAHVLQEWDAGIR